MPLLFVLLDSTLRQFGVERRQANGEMVPGIWRPIAER
jgi:hypothetical protein